MSNQSPTASGKDQFPQDPMSRDKRQSGDESEPLGDLGHKGKTWTPDKGEQGISNRTDDEDDGLNEGTGDATRD